MLCINKIEKIIQNLKHKFKQIQMKNLNIKEEKIKLIT